MKPNKKYNRKAINVTASSHGLVRIRHETCVTFKILSIK